MGPIVGQDDGFEEAFDALFSAARRIAVRLVGDGAAADVAQSLGVSAGSVKQHAHRAVDALRRTLGPGFLTVQELS